MEMQEIQEFFEVIDKIKHREREGWKKRDLERPLDSIASHSFGAALIGWIMAEEKGLDSDKIVKMLLLHDLIMAYVPDYTPEDQQFDSKKELEEKRMKELQSSIPDPIDKEALNLLQELRQGNTDEARTAKEADKLETILQAVQYSQKSEEQFVQEFLDFYRENFNSETATSLIEEIEENR